MIENTLKHIELNEFLDHIVKNEENIRFKELKDMIISIFTETAIEFTVLINANRSANQLSISSFDKIGNQVSSGILFRQRQCKLCMKYLDEDLKDSAIKKKGAFISSQGFDNSDDDD